MLWAKYLITCNCEVYTHLISANKNNFFGACILTMQINLKCTTLLVFPSSDSETLVDNCGFRVRHQTAKQIQRVCKHDMV